MYNPYQAPGMYGRPPDYGNYPGAPPGTGQPGMGPPGTLPPGMQQNNSQQPNRPAGLPASFQPPANMPNINFSAPIIRLGTSAPTKPSPAENGRERAGDSATGRGGPGPSLESQRQNIRDAILQLQPPSQDEILRTVFVGGITEGAGGDEGIGRILRSVGSLSRWIRATDADNKPCKFGFAEFADAESLHTAVEVLRDVEVPVKRQRPSTDKDVKDEVEMKKLLIVVDDGSLNYLQQYEANSSQDAEATHARLDGARKSLANVLSELVNPTESNDELSTADRDGDVAMGDEDRDGDEAQTEVVTIPIQIEDELSDIPAEMRETVTKEIAAFRDRSNRRDIERLRREEEIEALERSKHGGPSRGNRLASPPVSAPTGPNGGANGIPLGPRDRGMPNAPSGPKGHGHQIPKDYQKGVSFVSTNGINAAEGDEDTDASDSELERIRQEKKRMENDKQFLDQERRWLNRERSRTAAVEREKKREREEKQRLEGDIKAMADRLRDWDDDVEASRKVEEYFADRGMWIRNHSAFRAREIAMDEADRTAEAKEKARAQQQEEQARGMAESFLNRQAEEMESRAEQQQREPQRFKLSLGAAAQRAQATSRRTVAEVEGLLEDEEEASTTMRRPLTDIKFDEIESKGLTDEERAQAARQLAAEIPSEKDGLWKWEVKWDFLDESVLGDQLKPFVEKKIMEYLGVQEEMLVDVVEEHVKKRGQPQDLVEQLEGALDEEAEVLVKKLWRMIIFFSESEKRGLST